jgi:hypothetical protein
LHPASEGVGNTRPAFWSFGIERLTSDLWDGLPVIGTLMMRSTDVFVDRNGSVYATDDNAGLSTMKCTG